MHVHEANSLHTIIHASAINDVWSRIQAAVNNLVTYTKVGQGVGAEERKENPPMYSGTINIGSPDWNGGSF